MFIRCKRETHKYFTSVNVLMITFTCAMFTLSSPFIFNHAKWSSCLLSISLFSSFVITNYCECICIVNENKHATCTHVETRSRYTWQGELVCIEDKLLNLTINLQLLLKISIFSHEYLRDNMEERQREWRRIAFLRLHTFIFPQLNVISPLPLLILFFTFAR